MAKIEITAAIYKPIEKVFSVASNEELRPTWSRFTLEAQKISDGPIGLGTAWRTVDKVFGRQIERQSVFTEYVPNKRITQESRSGPVPFTVRWELEPISGGTRVKVIAEAQPKGLIRFFGPLMMSIRKRQFERDLANMKKLIEDEIL